MRCRQAREPTRPSRMVGPRTSPTTESCTDQNYAQGMHDGASQPRSVPGNFGKVCGSNSPTTLVGQHGYYQPIRQWVVVENDDQGQSAATDLHERRRRTSAVAFIHYLDFPPRARPSWPPSGMTPIS